jgi:hypothetical protein
MIKSAVKLAMFLGAENRNFRWKVGEI